MLLFNSLFVVFLLPPLPSIYYTFFRKHKPMGIHQKYAFADIILLCMKVLVSFPLSPLARFSNIVRSRWSLPLSLSPPHQQASGRIAEIVKCIKWNELVPPSFNVLFHFATFTLFYRERKRESERAFSLTTHIYTQS